MEKSTQIIYIQPAAPAKPHEGAPCNGCGVCCLTEPCPLGMLLSGKRSGACSALRWQAATSTYRCGALTDTAEVTHKALPYALTFAHPVLHWILLRSAQRWIAAGKGCDCTIQTLP